MTDWLLGGGQSLGPLDPPTTRIETKNSKRVPPEATRGR